MTNNKDANEYSINYNVPEYAVGFAAYKGIVESFVGANTPSLSSDTNNYGDDAHHDGGFHNIVESLESQTEILSSPINKLQLKRKYNELLKKHPMLSGILHVTSLNPDGPCNLRQFEVQKLLDHAMVNMVLAKKQYMSTLPVILLR